jgi:hypothetical protein
MPYSNTGKTQPITPARVPLHAWLPNTLTLLVALASLVALVAISLERVELARPALAAVSVSAGRGVTPTPPLVVPTPLPTIEAVPAPAPAYEPPPAFVYVETAPAPAYEPPQVQAQQPPPIIRVDPADGGGKWLVHEDTSTRYHASYEPPPAAPAPPAPAWGELHGGGGGW